MSNKMFVTETKNSITQINNISLRNLYLPIVGMEAITLYSLLVDTHTLTKNNPTFLPLKTLSDKMGVSSVKLEQSIKRLEAVGLLRTFEKADNNSFAFLINPAMTPQQFKNNSLLYREAVAKIGELEFERVFFNTQEISIKKDDYQEITVKYHDVFEIKKDVQSNTLELPLVEFASKEEAISGLTSTQFIKYISQLKASPSQMSMTQRLANQGLSSNSINLIIDYSFNKNNKVVINHIETIAMDLISKDIKTFNDIRVELNNAAGIKVEAKPVSAPVENSPTNDSSWNDLFDSLGGEL